ncbi:hypothetical protein Pmani_039814 [Petrolisthes manimaculis]|uniref:DNA helicase Pif1-like 2B domain-containing protein n=1 Tax=Petrolisthes manimaculis TaxID=1843537 RepID=A0AAE1TKZ2_9EUCA|nr:hypothetical protein Pmani_039814 [Petrolisthes manimaculis]
MDIKTSVFNSMRSPGLPPHKLKLKVGAVVMVVRNISPPKICNGTRVMVTNLRKHLIVDAPQEERPVPIPLPCLCEANNGRHLIGDEEPEGDRTVIPEAIYTVSEEEAVAMILPHYHYDDSDRNGRYSKELKGLKERIQEKMRQEEEHKAR